MFEKDVDLGGVWSPSRTYPGLYANNTRDTYAFSDHPYPPTADVFPSAEQVRAYLGTYADRFGLRPRLRLRSEVVRVARASGSSRGFRVTVRRDGGMPETHDFDFVAVCNGTFSIPQLLGVARKRTHTALGEFFLPLWPTRYRGVGAERRGRQTPRRDNRSR